MVFTFHALKRNIRPIGDNNARLPAQNDALNFRCEIFRLRIIANTPRENCYDAVFTSGRPPLDLGRQSAASILSLSLSFPPPLLFAS